MFCGALRTGQLNSIRAAAKGVLQCEDLVLTRSLASSPTAFLVSARGPRHLSKYSVRTPASPIRCVCPKDEEKSFGVRRMATSAKKTNRLALEKSPYLLQHATNPVDWYPWGDEAFEEARKQDKLIFLSVGYSTCHWCHVMEHESFESEDIAKIMNEHFINIKVDREERPDVDKVYMTFIQAVSGDGGWPMSIWLTPDLKPVHGGTYFPPNDRYFNIPGFKTLLFMISKQWKEDRQKFYDSGTKVMEILERTTQLELTGVDSSATISTESWKTCLKQLSSGFEPQFGGFNKAPKFPQPSNLNFLFHVYARNPDSEEGKHALYMCVHTLKMMAKGGIHDHVSQGFARYSTDEKWHVPHFEKMLYDQGQLLVSYSQAFVATKDEFFKEIIHDIFTYVNRDLSHQLGGFFSAEDADSLPGFDSDKKKEGAFCVWTHEEVDALLGSEPVKEGSVMTLADLACYHFDIKPNGNVNPYQDPHDELKNKNVLIVFGSDEETAEKFGISLEETKAAIKKIQSILHGSRQNRPRPHLDDKMVAAWNGLMLSGLSKAYEAVGDKSILERAERAASFLQQHMFNKETGILLRCCYNGEEGFISNINDPIPGFADDYSFVIRGLLDLYEASFNAQWLEWASQLQDTQDKLFWDAEQSGYFSTAQDPTILLRIKDGHDGAEPTCNSVSAANLMRLAEILRRPALKEKAEKLLLVFKERLEKVPMALPEMSSSLLLFQDHAVEIVLAGDLLGEGIRSMVAEVRSHLIPGRVLAFADGDEQSIVYKSNANIKGMKLPQDGSALAFVCRGRVCSLPVNKIEHLRKLLVPSKI